MTRYEPNSQTSNLDDLFDEANADQKIKALENESDNLTNTEDLLQKKQEILELFVRRAPAAIAMLDRDLYYLVVSDCWIKDFQLETKDIIGQNHHKIFPENPTHWQQDYQDILTGKVEIITNEEESFVRPSGNIDWLRWELRPWHDSEGKIGGLLMLSEIITERKLLEQKFFSSEAQMRAIFEAMTDLVLTVSLANNSIQILPTQFSDQYTFDIFNDIVEKTQALLFDSSESISYRKLIQQILDTQYSTNFEYSLQIDHNLMWFSVNAAPLDSQTVIWVAHNITQRKEMEQNLFAEKELAQVTLKSIGDAVITTDALGRVKYVNPIAEKLTGWKSREAQDKPLTEIFKIINQYTRESVKNPVDLVLENNSIYELTNNTLLIARNGTEYSIEDSAAPIQDHQGNLIGAVVVFHDVTKSRNLANKISWQATHDALTGLYNRRKFEEKVILAIQDAQNGEANHALCYLDLDRFKNVNDTCGHGAGDELLRQITKVLQDKIRDADIFARLGGDEFGILFHQCPIKIAEKLAEQLRATVQDFQFVWQDRVFQIGVSIGLVAVDSHTLDLTSLVNSADSACYIAKKEGRNCIHVYRQSDVILHQSLNTTESIKRLSLTLAENHFCLLAQPIMSLQSDYGRPKFQAAKHSEHYEIYLDLTKKSKQLTASKVFSHYEKNSNLMSDIDRWVISNFLTRYKTYCQQQGLKLPAKIYNLSLSEASINSCQFELFLKKQFASYAFPRETICFSITEAVAFSNTDRTITLMKSLKDLGCLLALDDFGKEISSFTYLKNLPIDYLKIDGNLIQNIENDAVDYAAVKCFSQISQLMRIKIIAKDIKDKPKISSLEKLGIDYGQGEAIGQPQLLSFV